MSTAVVEQQPDPLSRHAVSQALRSPTLPEVKPVPSPAASPSPISPPPPPPAPQTAPPPPVQPSTAPPPPAATTRTFSLVGGTAQLSCTNNQIKLNWATPNPGYWVDTGSSDSGATIDLRFRSDTHESELQAWCSGNEVQGTVSEKDS